MTADTFITVDYIIKRITTPCQTPKLLQNIVLKNIFQVCPGFFYCFSYSFTVYSLESTSYTPMRTRTHTNISYYSNYLYDNIHKYVHMIKKSYTNIPFLNQNLVMFQYIILKRSRIKSKYSNPRFEL